MTENRYIRASAIARAIVTGDPTTLEYRPFRQNYTDANRIHSQRQLIHTTARTVKLQEEFFTRRTGNIYITGRVDGFVENPDETLSLLEVKTYVDGDDVEKLIEYAATQIEVYAWLVRQRIPLANTHILELINRNTNAVDTLTITERGNIEDRILYAVYALLDNRDSTCSEATTDNHSKVLSAPTQVGSGGGNIRGGMDV